MNHVDVNPTTSSRALFWRNIAHAVTVIGGTLGVIAAAYVFLFAVLLGDAW